MRISLFVASALSVAVAVVAACNGQGEGEFCVLNANSSDCASGLVCEPAPGLPTSIVYRTRCCPSNPAEATNSACQQPAGDGGAPTEVLPVEAGAEAGLDAGPDAADAADAGSSPDASDATTD